MPPEIVTLTATSGAVARIWPAFGFNCFSLEFPSGKERVETLWSHPNFLSGQERPSGSGIPVLFPFPGRIRGGRFRFEGREFSLPISDGRGNAIHGFVHHRPWRVVEQAAGRVRAEFHAARDDAALLALWPADFAISVEYALAGRQLSCRIEVQNPDQRPLPFGLGTHPYFRAPLGAAGRREACLVRVPARRKWELVDLLPTGRVLDAGPALAQGIAFGEMQCDDVFTDLDRQGGETVCTVHDPALGRTLRIGFEEAFRECVVFNPPHREAVCIEPYTWCPNAFELAAVGHDPGLRILPPGETFAAGFSLAWTEG